MDFSIFDALALSMALFVGSAVVTPLLASRRKVAGVANFLFCLAAGVVLALISVKVLVAGGGGHAYVLKLGPASIPFLIDGLSALFLALIGFMGSATALYCIGYLEMEHYRRYSLRSFHVNYPLFLAGMAGIVTVDDLTTGFTVAWQAMTIASFLLIRFDHDDAAIVRAARKYLILMEVAWVAIVLAALLVPHGVLGSPLDALTEGLKEATPGVRAVIYGLLLFGFGMKCGMFPLGQLWLPDAHSSAPSPISALLSGVMIKTGVYGLLRVLLWMMPPEAQRLEGRWIGFALACFGVASLFIGTIQALKQHDAKRLHAYHSIGQMGYILLGIGTAQYFLLSGDSLLVALGVLSLIGGLYHSINHVLFKGLLFLCTGSVQVATGTKDLDHLGGLLKLMPVTAFASAVASAAIAGIPACSGFISKWAIIASDLVGGRAAGIVVLFGVIALMTSAITLASYIKFFGMTFTSTGIEWSGRTDVREVGAVMLVPMLLLSLVCLVQGLYPALFVSLFVRIFAGAEGSLVQALFAGPAIGAMLSQSYAGVSFTPGGPTGAVAFVMPVVLVAAIAAGCLFGSLLRRSGGSRTRKAPVWLCGYQTLNDSNRYLSRHIYASFKKMTRWTGGNVHEA